MSFRFYLLLLLVIAAPQIAGTVIHRVRHRFRSNAQGSSAQAKAARRTYFYPTRELDGNDTGYYGTEL